MSGIIIGAGVAGLGAAIRLAAQGQNVTVVESGPTYGGKIGEIAGKGFRFDSGPSLFTMPWLVDELLQLGNSETKLTLPYKRLDPVCRYFYPDGGHWAAPANPDELAEVFSKEHGEYKKQVMRHLNHIAGVYKFTAPVFLEQSLHKTQSWLNKSTLNGILQLYKIDMLKTLHGVNKRAFKNPKTVQFFDRFATYNGSNPYQAPGTLKVIPHLEIAGGAYLPQKGMRAIADVLYEKACLLGVKFQFNTPALRIKVSNNQVGGVETQNGLIPAHWVISNVDAKLTYSKLLQIPIPAKIKKAENSSSALVFYWGINTRIQKFGVHNIMFTQDYQKEFESIFKIGTCYPDPTVYVHITSRNCPTDAPENCDNLFVMINAPADNGQNWNQIAAEIRKHIIQKINHAAGFDIAPHIVFEQVLTPADIAMKTGSDKGSLYGSSSNTLMSAFNRQSNFSSKIKGLYFCGGSVHPGGGIPLCLMGAKITANLIQSDFKS